MNGYISYMDILAFTSKIKDADFENRYKTLTNYIGNHFHRDKNVAIFVVSDSILVISTELRGVKEYARMIYTWSMRYDFWIRGAIAQGQIEIIDPGTIVRENRNIILPYLGDAYLAAYNLENKMNMAGIVIDDNVQSDNPDMPLLENEDFVEYQEYLPKEGNESKKRIVLPSPNEEIDLVKNLHFRRMLGSHAADLDKYVNTFCFYVRLLTTRSDIRNVADFLDRLLEELNVYSRHLVIPPKVVILFVSVIEGLLYRNDNPKEGDDRQSLKLYIPGVVETLKKHGHLSVFRDYLIEYDRKRDTALCKYIHDILFG